MRRTVAILLTVAAALPAQVTITATHQPREALASQIGRIPRGLALYEVIACGRGEISTARVRQEFARQRLTLLAPSLGVVVAERERARGFGAALRDLPDLAPLATLGMAAAGPQAGTIAAAGISALVAGLRAGRDPRPVAMADPVRLTIGAECASYLTLARWPSRGRGPDVVTVEIR
jgi:hypothetical protein